MYILSADYTSAASPISNISVLTMLRQAKCKPTVSRNFNILNEGLQ